MYFTKKWYLIFSVILLLQKPSAPVLAKEMPNFITEITPPKTQEKPNLLAQSQSEIIVRFKDSPTARALIDVARKNSYLSAKYGISSSNLMVYSVDEDSSIQAITNILNNPFVQSAFPNYSLDLFALPNDPAIKATPVPGKPRIQWDMFNTKLADETEGVWDKTQGSSSITVAVIDSGIDSDHPEFSGKTTLVDCSLNPCKIVNSMNDSQYRERIHGTHVAGILAAATNNAYGMSGAGYNTKIMMVKIINSNGDVAFDSFIRALNYVIDYRAAENIKVVNLSLGQQEQYLDPPSIEEMHNIIARAYQNGLVLVAAAGNSGDESNGKSYPAAFPEVISVAALTVDNRLASYSQHNDNAVGDWVSVAAAGGECYTTFDIQNCIASTIPTEMNCSVPVGVLGTAGFCFMAGTSQATPHVSALAALLLSVNPNLTNQQIKQIIQTTANKSFPIDNPNATKYGAVDGLAAILSVTNSILPSATPVVSPSPTITIPIYISPTISPSVIPFQPTPTSMILKGLPRIPPDPYPAGPYCPSTSFCSLKTSGDADCDNQITDNDYNIWKQQLDTLQPASPANSNANFHCLENDKNTHFVNLDDFEVWRRNRYR